MDNFNPNSEEDRSGCSCVQKPICTPAVNNPPPPPPTTEYALLYNTGSFSVEAENNVTFEHQITSRNIEYSNGSVIINRPGVYHINYMVHFPVNATATIRFYLTRNDQIIDGSYSTFEAQTGTMPGQIIIKVRSRSKIELVSTTTAQFTTTNPNDTTATLSIIQLEGCMCKDTAFNICR